MKQGRGLQVSNETGIKINGLMGYYIISATCQVIILFHFKDVFRTVISL